MPDAGLIAYFQAHTNTYGNLAYLRRCYLEALEQPDVVGISIGTRPDCLPAEILSLLEEIAEKTSLTVELGLQTVHDKTACFFHRGYDFPAFVQAFSACGNVAYEFVCISSTDFRVKWMRICWKPHVSLEKCSRTA